MNELGHILREAREARGLTLAEVESDTRINSRFLTALEEGEYQLLPTPVHVRGFLRNYSRYLGLDPQPLLDRYELNHSQHDPYVNNSFQTADPEIIDHKPLNLKHNQPFFDPVNVEVTTQTPRNSESFMRIVIIVALLGMLYLVGSQFLPRLFGNNENRDAVTDSFNSFFSNLFNRDGESAEPGVDDTAVSDPDATPIASVTPGGVIPSTGRNILPTASPTRPSLPATMEVINLKIDITERTFMEVTVDGDVVFSGTAQKDDSFEWEADEEARILTGNAIGVNVTINEINLGRLGDRGQNTEESWRTTN